MEGATAAKIEDNRRFCEILSTKSSISSYSNGLEGLFCGKSIVRVLRDFTNVIRRLLVGLIRVQTP